MTQFIAGHSFPDFGPCSCGIRWSTIRNTTREEVGNHGIAHTAHLTINEYEQIERAREAEDERIAAATSGVCGATSQ